jgi:lipopolysaccharide/colanic/teichoic acid biosynthesis glycosyltransferase
MIATRPDNDAVVAVRYNRSVLETSLASYGGEGSLVWTDGADGALEERFREAIGTGWVSEVAVGPDVPLPLIKRLVPLAYESGRALRLVGARPIGELPPPSPTLCWTCEEIDGEVSWVMVRTAWPAWQMIVKRTFDLWVGMALTVALLPLLLFLALAVRLSSSGPILYRWHVLGRNGRPFTGYKFRTMVQDADKLKADLMAWNDMSGPVFKMARDPRITSIGHWLRKYSLDELPQIWSVIRGDMSLVGPRPPFRSEYEKFELWQMRKLSVVPGMTCLWQTGGRNKITNFADWARLDLEYIDNWSLMLDVKILARTATAVIGGTGH